MIDLVALHCLNALCDDYESVTTILSDVRRATHGDIQAEDIKRTLADLAANNLISVYEFDAANSRYLAVTGTPASMNDRWFFITEDGRKRLNSEWVE